LELYPKTEAGAPISSWAFEFISFADGPLEFEGGSGVKGPGTEKLDDVVSGHVHWTPRGPGLTFAEIPNAPRPGSKPSVRLAQMKELLKRFSITEHPGAKENVVLRPMPHPIDRYADEKDGLVDGAIFVFATGTNPEVLALLEARGPNPEKATWHFAVTRITAARFEVAIDRREVWTEGYAVGQRNPRESYNTTRLPRAKAL
jgi:hypothetical protein